MKPLVGAVVLLSVLSGLFGGKAHRKNLEGNREYEAKAYDEALAAYTEAQVPAPDAPELHYDLGNVLYRKGDFEGAESAYRRALAAAPPAFAPDPSYNLGNALYRAERYDEAVSAYRRALEARPRDADARRNLELALRALEAQKQPQPEKPQPDDQGEDEPRPQPQPSNEPEPRPEPAPKSGEEMKKEQAERLLDRLHELEKEAMRKKPEAPASARRPEKDW